MRQKCFESSGRSSLVSRNVLRSETLTCCPFPEQFAYRRCLALVETSSILSRFLPYFTHFFRLVEVEVGTCI